MNFKPTGTYLDRILADTAARLASRTDLPDAPSADIPPTRGFVRALAARQEAEYRPRELRLPIALIAEVKKASPSRGVIREDFDPQAIARIYQTSGASAISILTDEPHFQGKLSYLDDVRAVTSLPLLRKDFIIHPAQIYETVGRADAVLLIVAALMPRELGEFIRLAAACGLDALVEVHDRAEVEIALAQGAQVIGVNNRDLRTFVVDLQTTFTVLPAIPEDRLVVSESGIRTHEQVRRLAEAGVDAVLVGETFMANPDIGAAVKQLLYGAG